MSHNENTLLSPQKQTNKKKQKKRENLPICVGSEKCSANVIQFLRLKMTVKHVYLNW